MQNEGGTYISATNTVAWSSPEVSIDVDIERGYNPTWGLKMKGNKRVTAIQRYSWTLLLVVVLFSLSCQSLSSFLQFEPTATPIPPRSEAAAQAFLQAWELGDYHAMYDLLSSGAKAAISRQAFVERYQDVAAEATIISVATRLRSALQKGDRAQVAYSLTLDTILVGPIEAENTMTLSLESSPESDQEGARWGIDWSPRLILPELGDTMLLHMIDRIPSRGNIYDREGRGLATEGVVVVVGAVPGRIEDEARLLAELSRITGLEAEKIKARYAAARPDWFVPIADISVETYEAHAHVLDNLPGVELRQDYVRAYRPGGLAAHLIGYLGPIDQAELALWAARGYGGDELVGKAGLERWGEKYLAGRRGGVLTVITPQGDLVTTLQERSASPSRSIYSTIDRDFQEKVQAILGERVGAIVALDPSSGQILAIASSPTFDPNFFAAKMTTEQWQALLSDPSQPLLDRAIQGTYAPGSVFKIVTTAVALEEGDFTPDSTFECTGTWQGLGPAWTKTCWLKRGHGTISLSAGLTASCDVVFYELGQYCDERDRALLAGYARQFGLGRPTGLEGFDEAAGLAPDPAWKREALGEAWFPGDSVNLAIGQGYMLVTPLQVAVMLAAIGHRGILYHPQAILRVDALPEEPEQTFAPQEMGRLPLSAENLAVIQEALLGVTTQSYGTAKEAFAGLEVPVAGKTGTAENPGDEPHAWFAGYAPADDPQIAVAVVIEQGGEGSKVAAPIFRQVIEAFFGFEITPAPTLTPAP